MARRIVITSGKGGVGKTTIVSGLGLMLASHGYKVLLVDMDFGLNNLDVVMGIENKVVYDILGNLRLEIARRMNMLDKNEYNFLWVTEFPLLEYSEEDKRYHAVCASQSLF